MKTNQADSNDWVARFYHDLRELVDYTFPKSCSKCGRVYATKEQFIEETFPVKDLRLEDSSGLFRMEGMHEGGDAVGLFRNCVCGSTIMADFQDRRDNSEKGRQRRQTFDSLLDMLLAKGVSPVEGRQAILRILRGEPSKLIEELLKPVDLANMSSFTATNDPGQKKDCDP